MNGIWPALTESTLDLFVSIATTSAPALASAIASGSPTCPQPPTTPTRTLAPRLGLDVDTLTE